MNTKRPIRLTVVILSAAALAAIAAHPLQAGESWHPHPRGPAEYGEWQPPQNLQAAYPGADVDVNTDGVELCPAVSSDGRTLYFVSNRPGGVGGFDIWISRRDSVNQPWGKPENPGEPLNSTANELCSTPFGSHGFLLVSARSEPGACGGTDIYFTWRKRSGWAEPLHLDCDGVNSAGDEMAPSIVEYFDPRSRWKRTMELYFSSSRAGGFAPEAPGTAPDGDIYYAKFGRDGSLEAPELVPGVNAASQDHRPTVRADGLEMFFDSNRAGTLGGPLDIWSSTRASVHDAWAEPRNDLGPELNTVSGESRPNLSGDGTHLYFASTRPGGRGGADIWVAVRERERKHHGR